MDSHTLSVLEFDQVLQAAAGSCQTELGRRRVLALRPLGERERIELEQDLVAQMSVLIRVEGRLSLAGLHDLDPWSDRVLTEGAFLSPEELDLVRQTLVCLAQTSRRLRAKAGEYPLLAELGRGLSEHKELIRDLERTLGPGLTINDSASPELGRIRRNLSRTKQEIRLALESIMGGHGAREIFSQEVVTQRNDRFVVPVKASAQGRLEGIIHDSSASRRTVFVEPLSVVSGNNRLGLLSAEERREVIRILTGLTRRIGLIWPQLGAEIEIGARLDSIQARASFGLSLNAIRPELGRPDWEGSFGLRLLQARHPLLILAGGKVVPVDLIYPDQGAALIISGPNAGGKTVALKTLGLLSLMAFSGLPIPAGEGSRLPEIPHLAAAIGDEQAISQGASTFSARLSWLKKALAQAREGSLILIDELGGGTDPAEGAALGLAVLDRLMDQGARVAATTHLNLIKAQAAGSERVENVSVSFDPSTQRPTYSLTYGQPGLSKAFEAAAMVGLEEEVVARAKGYLGGEEERFKTLLERLGRLIDQRQEELREAEAQNRRLRDREGELEELGRRLEEDRDRLLAEEGGRLKQLAKGVEKELAAVLEQANSREHKERERARYRFYETKARIGRNLDRIQAKDRVKGGRRPAGIGTGQRVRVAGYKQPGTVERELKDGQLVEVRLAGGLKLKIDPARLKPLEEENRPRSGPDFRYLSSPDRGPLWPEVNIIGLRVDEALPRVEQALDEAVLTGLSRLSVIHGVGTGALRQAVRDYLVDHPLVRTFSAPEGLRGAGVTEVELGG